MPSKSTRVLTLGRDARGHIPTQLGMMSRLVELRVERAPELSGTIPTELLKLDRLWHLSFEDVPRLSGTLPRAAAWDGLNRALLHLKLQHTRVSGTLPDSLPGPCRWWPSHPGVVSGTAYNTHQCHFRARLELCCNALSGTLPRAVRFGTGVAWSDLRRNPISGTLPVSLASYHRLDLSATRISGSLPSELDSARGLWSLSLPPPLRGWDESLLARRPAWHPEGAAAKLYNGTSGGGTRLGFTRRVLSNYLRSLANARQPPPTSSSAPLPSIAMVPSASPPAPLECCIHGCRGRGACVRGWCVCWPPWSGMDCGVLANVPPGCALNERRGVFVGERGHTRTFEMPSMRTDRHSTCAAEPLTAMEPRDVGIYAAPSMLLLRLLRDQRFRAPSESCAQARWDPLFSFRLHANTGLLIKWQLQAAVAADRTPLPRSQLIPQPSAAAPLPNGLPQIWEDFHDRGVCDAPRGLLQPGDIVLGHWGDIRCLPAGVRLVVLPPGSAGRDSLGAVPATPQETNGTMRGFEWRVADARLASAARSTYEKRALHHPRTRALFFRGSTREKRHPAERKCYAPKTPNRHCRSIYSMGMRQMVHRILGDHPIVHFNRNTPEQASNTTSDYHALLRSFDFCLCAPGKGFGNRIVDYVASGCIPVILRPGDLYMPLEPELRYDDFAVSIPFEAVPMLPGILANMSDAAIRAKRQRLFEVHKLFLWDEDYGEAYEAVMWRVSQKLSQGAK